MACKNSLANLPFKIKLILRTLVCIHMYRGYVKYIYKPDRSILLFILTSFSRLFHSYRDESISRWGENGSSPGKNHLTQPQEELDLSHIWPKWGSNPHQPQRWNDRMIKGDNETSRLNHSATHAGSEFIRDGSFFLFQNKWRNAVRYFVDNF